MNKFRALCLFSLVFMISGCGPSYKTTYRFSAPPTDIGKTCARSCLEELQACRATCKKEISDCKNIQDLKADNDYLQYANDRLREGKEVDKQKYQFRSYSSCNMNCEDGCESSHRICHVNCGGDVIEQTICTARCDQI